ncbi:MAG TPA: alkaline phosphatase family protein [Patescibacteria group bacterium]|nr:alkaline phosphatase family protein [Patescibacteria group bacterium]
MRSADRRRWAWRLSCAVLLGLLAFGSAIRVPAGTLGVLPSRLLAPGWHLRLPFAPVHLVPIAGRVSGIEIPRTSPEGARLVLRLALDYRLDPERLPRPPGRLFESGVDGLVIELARPAVDALAAADLQAGGDATAFLSDAGSDAIARALLAGGVTPEHLDTRPGPGPEPDPGITPAGGGSAAAAGGLPRRDPTGLRLLFIGLDGGDWKTIDPLLRAGRLPHLARLVASGARAPLRSYDPMISPLLWTTMATGVGPDRHGVADFQAIETASGRRVPITSRFRRVKALWNILDDAGGTSAFVGWWASYPAEAVRGFQVSNLVAFETMRPRAADHPLPFGLTWPSDYLASIAPRLATAEALRYEDLRPIARVTREEFEAARREVLAPPPAAEGGESRRAVQRPVTLALSILTATRNYAAIASDLAARHPDLTSVYFEGIDMIGHRFQHCMPPRLAICGDADYARFQDAVTGFYEAQDRFLGQVVDAAGPGATILVVSDHGFRAGAARPADIVPYTTEQPVEWHDPEGIFLLSGPGARRGVRLAARPTLFDVAPTVLHLLGLPAGGDMPGRVVTGALDEAFLSAHPPRVITSWETVGGSRRTPSSAGDPAAREAEAELLASLRSLGYIGGDEPRAEPGGASAGDAKVAPAGTTGATAPAETTQVFYHRNLATYFLKRKDYAHAAEQLLLANERQPLPKTYEMLSEAYLGMGRTPDAVTALRSALDASPDATPEPVLWLVQLRLQDAGGGSGAAAEDVRRYAARTAARAGLDDAIAGLLAERSGDPAGALDHYRRSFAADPTRILVAQRLYALEPPDRRAAILLPALRRSVDRDPRQDEAQNLLGLLQSDAGREQEAIAAFERAGELDPDNARYAANLGGACARAGRWREAAEAYERADALAPSAASALRLGSVYRRLGEPDKALAAFAAARDRGDDTAAPFLGLALVQSERGRNGEALRTVDDGLLRHPGDDGLTRLREDLARRPGGGDRRAPPRTSTAGVVPPGR